MSLKYEPASEQVNLIGQMVSLLEVCGVMLRSAARAADSKPPALAAKLCVALRSSLEGGGGWADAADGWGTGFEAQVPPSTLVRIACYSSFFSSLFLFLFEVWKSWIAQKFDWCAPPPTHTPPHPNTQFRLSPPPPPVRLELVSGLLGGSVLRGWIVGGGLRLGAPACMGEKQFATNRQTKQTNKQVFDQWANTQEL